ncbi:MAG: hypothetical protein P1U35_13870 [Cycloclasticus sp.]|nr:hypothetical protein [Cycloclasticus sp.]
MNQYQLKYLLTVLGAFALLVSFTWLDGASGYSIENKRLLSGFFCLVYFAWAFSFRGTYQKIRNTRLLANQIIRSGWWQAMGVGYLFVIIVVSFYFLFSGGDIGQYLDSFIALLLVFSGPFLIPFSIAIVEIYVCLGKVKA